MTAEFEDQVQETEGELIAKEAQTTDSPFSGYGRPFSEDPLRDAPFSMDNPANNVGPYSGPNSYSINTVAPYAPPGQDTENPGQNVGPYKVSDPGNAGDAPEEEEDDDEEGTVRRSYKEWNDKQWFDGTSTSIYSRAIEAESLRRQAHASGDVVLEDELAEQVDILSKTAAEYDDSSLHEAMEDVPGGTVALEYDDLVDGGLVDVTSFLSTGAFRVAKEASEYDWDAFKADGARIWVNQKIADNPGLIKHEVMCREAAVDYAKDKTMVLMDPTRRADVIDEFVSAAERYRREAAKRLIEDEAKIKEDYRQIEAARMDRVAEDVSNSLDNFLPGSYTEVGADYDDEGYLAIGEDDGTPLYAEAKATIEASKRDWESFTTEGAREWFFAKVLGSPMAKHADITFRAAKKYATDQASTVPDAAMRAEIARAFSQSVEYLRESHAADQADVEPEPEDALGEVFGEEQLW